LAKSPTVIDGIRFIEEGTSADAGRPIIDGDGWIDEIAARIGVADAQFGELAGTAADRVLMTIGASPRVEDRPKPAIDVGFRWHYGDSAATVIRLATPLPTMEA
jgi:hypothetical protein